MYHPDEYRGRIGKSLDGLEQLALASRKRPMEPGDSEWIRALYDAEVTYHDAHMGKFLDQIDEMGLLDETLFIVTNDHGEELRGSRQAGARPFAVR